jgi:endo-1,4-beta-D-glucanase Y
MLIALHFRNYLPFMILLLAISSCLLPMKSMGQGRGPGKALYTIGIIKPNHKSAAQLNRDLCQVYDRWKSNYLCALDGTTTQYYLQEQRYPALTVSEAHGYGMVTIAYMAWYDNNAKKYFDGMFHFFKANPSEKNIHLMNWEEETSDIHLGNPAGNSATDGDMDIAYALLLADKQWGSSGEINYKKESLTIIHALEESIIHSKYKTLKMGDWAQTEGYRISDATRPSDFMIDHLRAFKKASGDEIWSIAIDSTYKVIRNIYMHYSPNTGLMPDFAEREAGKFVPAKNYLLESEFDGSAYYNSARFPWRLGTEYIIYGDKNNRKQLLTINKWIQDATQGNPANIASGYMLDGAVIQGKNYEDLAFQSPFMVSAMVDKINQKWLNKLWDNGLNFHRNYYGDSITMLCMIVASGNWWSP